MLNETLLGTDIGGDVWIANGGHNGVGNINLNAAQTRRRNKRNKKLFALIYSHVSTRPSSFAFVRKAMLGY